MNTPEVSHDFPIDVKRAALAFAEAYHGESQDRILEAERLLESAMIEAGVMQPDDAVLHLECDGVDGFHLVCVDFEKAESIFIVCDQ